MTDAPEIFADNAALHRFELTRGGQTAFATYRDSDGSLAITHVEVPTALRGTGMAARLMEAVATHARAHGMKLIPRCPYATVWFHRRPQFADVLI